MMEAASTTETSVNFYQATRRNIPEESFSTIMFIPQFLPVTKTAWKGPGLDSQEVKIFLLRRNVQVHDGTHPAS
jgi:hypothetical protein